MVRPAGAGSVLPHILLSAALAIMLAPIWFAIVVSTSSVSDFLTGGLGVLPGDQAIANYRTVLVTGASNVGLSPVGPMLLNSFMMAVAIAAGKIAISIISAYAVAWFRFPFRTAAFWTIFITLMLPVEVRILPTFGVTADLGLLNSFAGLTIPIIASATATFLFRQVFMTIPDELTEAARIDNAGPVRFFFDVVLPLSRTNIAALAIILFIYGWNQYLWPLLVTTDTKYYTVVMGIQRLAQSAESSPVWHLAMATAILAMLPPVLVVLSMQKLFVRGLVETEK
ncbi:MAG: sn-glycerol-3-phosphate ABC transporter permease UgpE [Methylobacteriaceae bacterium]|nr:sn-glycerol-3-phosphate ABC transporter permease UgpE [Methylobacteriaceae bacterium]